MYERFRRLVPPYATGNPHPGFMGWGMAAAALSTAELLAGGLNAEVNERNHALIGLLAARTAALPAGAMWSAPG